MGMSASEIESFENLDGLWWREATRRIWVELSPDGKISEEKARNAIRGEEGDPDQAARALAEAQKRGLLMRDGEVDGLRAGAPLSKYASSTTWDRFGEPEAVGMLEKIARRARERGGRITENVGVRSIWLYGSAAGPGKASFGDLDMFAEFEWIGEGKAPSDPKEAARLIVEAGKELAGDERADIGPGCYAPRCAEKELEWERNGKPERFEMDMKGNPIERRRYQTALIWEREGGPRPVKGCSDSAEGLFDPFSEEQRRALGDVAKGATERLKREEPGSARVAVFLAANPEAPGVRVGDRLSRWREAKRGAVAESGMAIGKAPEPRA